jgi:hypothetical protein
MPKNTGRRTRNAADRTTGPFTEAKEASNATGRFLEFNDGRQQSSWIRRWFGST